LLRVTKKKFLGSLVDLVNFMKREGKRRKQKNPEIARRIKLLQMFG